MKKVEIATLTLLTIIVALQLYSILQVVNILSLLSNFQIQQIPSETSQQFSEWRVDCGNSLENYDAVFIYLDTCPHSQRMKPLVEASKLNWYWINPRDSKCFSLNLSKFNFYGFVPHFYCLKTNQSHTGAMPEDEFKNWTLNCG